MISLLEQRASAEFRGTETKMRHGTGTIKQAGSGFVATIETKDYPTKSYRNWTTNDIRAMDKTAIRASGQGATAGEAKRAAEDRYADVGGSGKVEW